MREIPRIFSPEAEESDAEGFSPAAVAITAYFHLLHAPPVK